jgi:hypothetical protein
MSEEKIRCGAHHVQVEVGGSCENDRAVENSRLLVNCQLKHCGNLVVYDGFYTWQTTSCTYRVLHLGYTKIFPTLGSAHPPPHTP